MLSTADGVVTKAGWDENGHELGYGLVVEVEHFINDLHLRTRYGHLSTISVHENQNIKAGTIFGTSGSTGGPTGPHLHFDVVVLEDGIFKPVDPFGWKPVPGAEVQNDPWAQTISGTESWCMWKDGE